MDLIQGLRRAACKQIVRLKRQLILGAKRALYQNPAEVSSCWTAPEVNHMSSVLAGITMLEVMQSSGGPAALSSTPTSPHICRTLCSAITL